VFVPITPEVSSAFGTPILKRAVASATALNVGLERAILARAQKGAANRISNVGGWQSLPDLLDWPEPEIKLLVQEVDRSIQQISALPATLAQQPDPPRVHYPRPSRHLRLPPRARPLPAASHEPEAPLLLLAHLHH
jgi:hypothetical protein